jgi:predicted component of type VI protein secretion system
MRQNPGISLPEAFQKLTFMKAAAAAAAGSTAQEDAAATAAAAAALGLTAASATASGNPLTGVAAGTTRAARELHIGSLPQGMPAPVLHEALNQALIAQGVGKGTAGSPVVSIRYGGDGHYAFGELRTVQVSSRCAYLQL